MPRKLIIGCGYLGRRVAKRWIAAGDTVFALTRSPDRANELRKLGVEPIIGDVTQPESLEAFPPADIVLYAVGFDRSAGHAMRSVYVDGLQNVVATIGRTTGRFLYISSTSVYGQCNGEWVDENSPCEPVRGNGKICLEAEQSVRTIVGQAFQPDRNRNMAFNAKDAPGQAGKPDLRWNILRLAGIYGPGRLLRRMEAIRSGEPIDGNPDAFLNLIHVDDAAAAVDACLERGEPGRTYLISDDRPVTRQEYFTALATHLNGPPPVFNTDTTAARTPGLNKRCRNRLMHEELRVRLQYPTIHEGLPGCV